LLLLDSFGLDIAIFTQVFNSAQETYLNSQAHLNRTNNLTDIVFDFTNPCGPGTQCWLYLQTALNISRTTVQNLNNVNVYNPSEIVIQDIANRAKRSLSDLLKDMYSGDGANWFSFFVMLLLPSFLLFPLMRLFEVQAWPVILEYYYSFTAETTPVDRANKNKHKTTPPSSTTTATNTRNKAIERPSVQGYSKLRI
jgi:hypothetical protein